MFSVFLCEVFGGDKKVREELCHHLSGSVIFISSVIDEKIIIIINVWQFY